MRPADDHCGQLLGAYVLGACPEPEADGVTEHLAQCATCAAEAQWLREGADLLLHGVAPVAPPAGLKDRVMRQVRSEAVLFDAARTPVGEPSRSEPGPSLRFRSRLPRVRLRAPAVALASILILVVIGAGLLSGGLGSSVPDRNFVVAQIEEGQRGASGSLEIRGERAELRVRGLRSPSRGRIYQVWVRKDRQVPEPAGATLEIGPGGAAQAHLSGDIRRFDQVLVTSEPAGGSRLPTRPPVLDVDTST